MKTLTDIIICERDPIKATYGSGILIKPDWVIDAEHNEHERGVITGTVKVCGPDCKVLKPGMRVMWHKSQHAAMDHEGQDFSVFHEGQCLAIID